MMRRLSRSREGCIRSKFAIGRCGRWKNLSTTPTSSRRRNPQPDDDLDPIDGIVRAIDELWSEATGDALVFLPGEREIRDAAEALRNRHQSGVEVLPLYGRLSSDQQMKVFQSSKQARIVLATNVAETSLTVPGIRYVVDLGLARLSRYNARTKVQRLPIEPISQASAESAKGTLWPSERGRVRSTVFRGRLRRAVCVYRTGNSPHQPRERHPSNEVPEPRPDRGVSVHRPARHSANPRWISHAPRAGGHR